MKQNATNEEEVEWNVSSAGPGQFASTELQLFPGRYGRRRRSSRKSTEHAGVHARLIYEWQG